MDGDRRMRRPWVDLSEQKDTSVWTSKATAKPAPVWRRIKSYKWIAKQDKGALAETFP